MIRKAVALLVAYSFLATSLVSQAAAGERLPSQSTTAFLGSRAATELFGEKALDSALSNFPKFQSNNSSLASAHKALTNPAVKAPVAFLQGGSGGGTSSSIKSNFNGTAISTGDTIWFTAVLKLNGTVPKSPVSIAVHNSTIQFAAGSTNYSVNVPGAVVTFSPTVTTSTATFDTANNPQPVWLQNQLNPQPSGNTLLQAFAFAVPAGGLPGGIQNVTWTSTFTADTANITLNWQWAAAVYTGCVSSTYNSDDAKPTDDTNASVYKNSDHAGTPEACKSYVAQGATGGGGSNYTGSLSGTASVTPSAVAASPVITAAVSPTPNSNGWNNTSATVSFACSDANFAIATCPAPVTVSTEGAGQIITGTAVDQAGGSATAKASVTVNVDKTSPSITAAATSSSGGGSVLTLPVTINFTCTDSLSGVASCPAPIQVTTTGANQVFSGTATDKAGNTASTSIAINTEKSPLAVTASLSPAPNNGWNNTNVSISYQCTGGVPPVQCPQATTVSTEGAGQKISAAATDSAGQSSTVTTTLNIDKTAPTISATTSPAPNAAGWNTSDVTITYACSDNLSGVASCPPQRVVSTEGATQQFTATASDNAGNAASAAVVLNIEKTAPAITASLTPAPNAAGWNNSSATVSFTCSPSVSPIVICPAAVSVTTEGKGQDISGTVTDQAGKSNSASLIVNLDETPPSIGITTPVAGGYTNVALAPITVSYADSGSGVDVTTFKLSIDGVDQTAQFTITATGATGIPAAALSDGLHSITASIKDLAGNQATATTAFTVDTVPPQITITQPPNGLFTNATSVVVTGSVVDASPVTVTVAGTAVPVQNRTFTSAGITLGTNATQSISVVATDAAGNSSTVTLTINIDRTPPTITGAINPLPNAAGWNNTAVTVTFTCSDSDSGVATCPSPVSVTAEGANQAITGTAVDKAGNTAQATVTVNIDETPPVITGTPAPAANAAGWNTTDVTITYVCSDTLSGIVLCPAPRVVTTDGKAQQITANVSDKAGNTSSSTVSLNIEKTAPSIAASVAPSPNAAGWNNTNVNVSFACTPSASDITNCQTPISVTTEGKAQVISGTVTDQAGKSNTATATVNLDKTPPLISASPAPPPNAAGWNNTNVVITYLCSDSLSGVAFCPSPATVSTEGAAQNISAQATDVAGNTAAVTSTLKIDKTPPVVTVTAAPSPNGAGWNNTNVTVTFSCTDSLSGVASCPTPQLVASEGQNQNISGQATDVAGNVATGSISLSIDKTPPTIVQLSTPDHISRLHSGQVSVTVNDNFFVSQVVISVNGTSLGTFTSAPYQAALSVPAGSNPGDTLTITAVATDEAGNSQSASRAVRVSADGVIVGQVLSDVTSFPIQGAVVQTISTTAASNQTDDRGRYSLQASDSHLFLSASNASPATTTVEREVFVQSGVGTVPVDARLTPLSAPVTIGSAGGTVTAGNITITIPGGVVGDGTTFQLTPLTGQGLPGLLPLGWTPFAAFDLRASSSVTNLSTAILNIPNTVLHLVTYNPALHAWTMVQPGIAAPGGQTGVFLPSAGTYALVFPDAVTPPITIPAAGAPLPGIPMQLLDAAASSNGSLSPAIVPPSGGTSIATLGVQTTAAVPSGTVIQANISEKFSLKSGDVVSEETRSEDIVLYRAVPPPNATMGAQFAVTPSQKYTNAQLLTGKVHLDILAGREGVRGQPGGSDPVTLTDGIATLSVPGGALSQDTAINVQSISLEDFVPSNGSIGALQEVLVDFSGEVLNTPGQLSISSTALNPAHTFLLTQVQRIDGVPHMVLVALAQISGANLTSVASPGLPGITQGGEYVFYDVSAPVGFVQGVVSSSGGPVQGLVQTDSLPIVSITGADGKYIVPAISGTANLKASSPHTNLAGSAAVQVTAGQTTPTNILLAGTVTNAVVSPADGTLGVPASTTITITATAPLNPQSISQANLVLLKGTVASGTPVPLQPFVLSTSGTVLSFAPVSNLDPATQYTIQVAGLADTFGGAVVVPVSSFTTKAVTPLNFDPNALTFSVPDQNGNIQVTAPANSLPPGTQVLIVDQTTGLVLSLTALNDGSVSGNFPGTVNDTLQVTLTDPKGSTASFTRSQFVAADGSVAVGPGGGTVTGPGNIAIIIPQGALSKGTSFKLTPLDQTAFPVLPTWPGANFGSGIHIDAPAMPSFNEEVKLAFPVPANAPQNAFYYVYRRLTDQDGNVYFDTIDHAFVQGTGSSAQVVTASPPFCGYRNSYGKLQKSADGILSTVFTAFQDFILMFEIPNFDTNEPGVASQGLIVGKATQVVLPNSGQTETTFLPVGGATVSLDSDPSRVATTDATCGTFTLFDPRFGGGLRNVTISNNGKQLKASVNEVNPFANASAQDALFGPFGVTAGLERLYKNIGTVNFTFPPAPVIVPPQIDINIYTLDANNQRQPVRGIVASGTPLVITFATSPKLTLTGVSIAGTPYAFGPDTSANFTDGLTHSVLTSNYSAGVPGVYSIVATAKDPLDPAVVVTEGKSFLVVTAGNGQITLTPGVAPAVIDNTPSKNAINVPTSIFPQITFSEPVTHVAGNITLVGSRTGDSPELLLIGIRADGSIANPVAASDVITVLTIQPASGLQFNEQYTLTLASGIIDQNSPPLALATFTLPFTTAGGQELGGTPPDDSFSATRPVVIGDRAYLGVPLGVSSGLDIVDITDPTLPKDKGIKAVFIGRAIDATGQKDSPVARCRSVAQGQPCTPGQGGGLVAVAAAQPGIDLILPSNVYIYDVSTPDVANRVGAVSVTTSTTQDGEVLRLFMKDQFLYTTTFLKGLQVVDLQQALDDYRDGFGTNPTQFGKDLTTEGTGFANDSVVNTIPLPMPICSGNTQPCQPVTDSKGNPQTFNGTMWDVKAGDFALNNSTQTLLVSTGMLPLVVADPLGAGQTAVFFPPRIGTYLDPSPFQFQQKFNDGSTATFILQSGRNVALGTFSVPDGQGGSTTKQIAVVTGGGTSPPLPDGTPARGMLIVVDMSDPHNPMGIGAVQLSEFPIDLILKGSTALIGTGNQKILLVNLNDPTHPIAAGEIDGPTLGDHLALTDSGIIISSSQNPLLGGLHTAGLESECVTQRNNLKNLGPSIASISYPLKSLDWTIGGGAFTLEDGYVLTAVQLGDRLMANTMSLPYVTINRTPAGGSPTTMQCVLSSNTPSGACMGSPTSRSQQLSLTYFPSAGDQFGIEAKFLLDRLDGDHDQDPTKPDSCVILTQHYEFWREGFDAPEASDEFSAARFKPTVTYQYFTDTTGPVLNSFSAAQRFQFAPTAFTVNDVTTPKPFSYGPSSAEIDTLFYDCELSEILLIPACAGFPLHPNHIGTNTPFGNAIPQETTIRVIQNGDYASAVLPGKTTGDPASPFRRADNLHLRAYGGTTDIEGPTTTGHPGCPECVHIHWRWGSNLTRTDPVGAVVVSPRFDNNAGKAIIPFGSNQDIDIGILQANIGGGHGTEEHPAFGQTYLTFATQKPINTGVATSFWYSATGHANQDSFMVHGGFFGSLKVTIGNPGVVTNNALFFPLNQAVCSTITITTPCTVSTDIRNRTGHTVRWTATLTDRGGIPVISPTTGEIGGAPNFEYAGTAKIDLPPGITLFPTYILDIKVVDEVTGWSTERQAFVTSGIQIFLPPLVP